MKKTTPRFALLATLMALAVTPVAAAGLFSSDGYPSKGRALDALKPAKDYSDVVKQRPRALAIMRARAHGFVPAEPLRDYAKRVLVKIVANVPLPPSFQPELRILAAPDLNALCTPDGTVVVSIGLLQQIQSEDELAFVLAHEISHAIYRHHGSDWFTRTQYYAIRSATMLDEIGTKLNNSGAAKGMDMKGLDRQIAIAERVYTLSENVLAPQFQQDDEDEADALGLDLMVRAGYNPEAAQTFLERLAASEDAASNQAKNTKQSEKKPAASTDDIGSVFNKLGSIADLALDLADKALDEISKEIKAHRPASERSDLLAKYQFAQYRDLKPSGAKALPWRLKTNGDTRTAALLTNYRSADALAEYLQGLDGAGTGAPKPPAKVETAAAGAIVAPTADHAYTEYAVARYRTRLGRNAQATAALNAAYKSSEPSWIAYDALIDANIARNDFAAAAAVMTVAQTRFEDSPVLLPKRIAILRGLRRDSEIAPLLTQCSSYDVRELRRQCDAAAGKS